MTVINTAAAMRAHTPERLTMRCDVCKKPVTGRRGYVCVDKRAVYKRQEQVRQWKADNPGPVISGTALLTYPDAVPWHIYHRACDLQRDSDHDYWFDVGRADTPIQLLEWTAHLLEKTWLTDTDWSVFLYRVLNANGWSCYS